MRRRKPRYINEYIDRHGKPRVYLRRPGRPQVALPAPLYSQEFWTAYHAAMADEPARTVRRKPGSVAAAVHGYYSSLEFRSLAPSTQAVYRGILDRFVAKHGDGPIAGIATRHVNLLIDSMADTPTAASNFRKRLKAVMDYAVSAGMRSDNPVTMAKKVKYQSDGHRTWSEADIAAYRAYWREDTPERLAMELMLYTGVRRSDAVRIGWEHVVDGRVEIVAKKTGAELSIPIHVDLWPFIKDTPPNQPTFIATLKGRPRSEKAFSAYISEAAGKAGLPAGSAPHGLRKAACRRLAEAGCSAMEIMSITGHTDIREVERYCREAAKRGLAASAMARLKPIELPNPPDELGNIVDKGLKNKGEKEIWRSRQDSNLRPSA